MALLCKYVDLLCTCACFIDDVLVLGTFSLLIYYSILSTEKDALKLCISAFSAKCSGSKYKCNNIRQLLSKYVSATAVKYVDENDCVFFYLIR